MMKWKRMAAVAMAGAMTVSLAACGGSKKESGGDGGSSKSSGDGSLTVAIWDTYQEPGLTEILKDFTEETGIKAKIQVTPWDQYWTMLEAGATGGSLPDVFWMHSNQVSKYAKYDMLMDLTDKLGDVDLSKYPEGLVKLYQNDDGKQIAVPKDVDSIALWYNKAAFDEAGLAYPDDTWTWDTFKDAAKTLTKADGSQYGTVFNPKANQESYYNLVYDWGGNIINDDKTKSGWDDPKTIEAMEYIDGIIKDGSMPDYNTIAENEALALFESGKVAMCPFGSWMVSELIQNDSVKANCDVAVLPKKDDTRISIYNGLGWAADGSGKNTENAAKLIAYLGSEEAQKKQADLGVTLSAYEGASEGFAQKDAAFNLKAYTDMMEDTVLRPYSIDTVTWENMSQEKLVDAWNGSKTMADVCKDIATEMNADLEKEKSE